MNHPLSLQENIYVLKDGNRIGPLSVDEILDFVEEGTLDYNDLCLREGSAECERIREVLDWETDYEPPKLERKEPKRIVGNRITDLQQPAFEVDTEEIEEVEKTPLPAAHGKPKDPPGPADLAPSTILYRGHPSIAKFPGALLGIMIGIGFGIWLHDVSVWITAGGFTLALLCFSYLTYCRAVSLYLISPKRVEIITGLIAKNSREARIVDVRAINVTRSGFAGVFGVGTVEFSTAGEESEVTFSDVWSAHDVKALVRTIQDNQK